MSSPDREDDTGPSAKKRKVQRACDYCRRKKIKCDGPQRADNRCSKCTSRRTDCTYVEPLYKNFYPVSYVDKVEGRMQRLEQLLKKLSPGIDITKELDSTLSDNEGGSSASVGASTRSDTSTLRTGKPSTSTTLSPPIAASPSIPAVLDDLDPSDDESELQKNIVDGFNRLSIDPVTYRYHGKSSGLVFVRAAKHLKDQIEADMTTTTKAQSTEEPPRSVNKQYAPIPWLRSILEDAPPPFTEFPPEDLLGDLMNLYFREMNDYMPLLHEPTFKQCIKNGLQHHHGAFGGTLLLVCACGARFSDDPRVLLEGTHNTESAGWKWFETVERVYKSYMAPATVYDLQVRVLLVLYLQGTTVPHTSWTHIGIGVRMGVDIGAHRKKMYGAIPTIEEEMIRRAFWILVVLDWGSAYSMGRPASIHDEDMDLGLPLECDDEYWISSGGERAFQQPHGRPSKNCFFTSYIRLCQILAFAVRTVYSINKSKSALGHGDQQWEQRIVADLDSALNRWVDTVPGHLRWDPDREDTLFLKQSAVLLSHYYQFQIAVHRPFISTRRGSPLSFPSLIICTNAARSGVRVVSHLYQRTGDPSYKNLSSLFMCAVVLLLSVWGERKSGRTVNAAQDVAYVKKCLEMIRACHRKMATADRLGDILHELVTSGTPLESGAESNAIPPNVDGVPGSDYIRPFSLQSFPPSSIPAPDDSSQVRFRPGQDSNVDDSRARDGPVGLPSSSSLACAFQSQGTAAMFGTSVLGLSSDDDMSPLFSLPLRTEELAHEYAPASIHPVWQQPPHQTLSHLYRQESAQQFGAVQHGNDRTQSGQLVQGTAHSQFDTTSSGNMFGLEPMGYHQSTTLQPFSASSATTGYRPQIAPVGAGSGVSGSQSDSEGTPEYAFADDSLTVWANAPTFYGWDDWGGFLGNMNGTNPSSI